MDRCSAAICCQGRTRITETASETTTAPENLELWTTPQPTGIRAGEALAWAREIIARYGPAAELAQGN